MKKTIIQCVTAFICVLALALTTVSSVDKITKVKPLTINNGTSSSSNGGSNSGSGDNGGSTDDNGGSTDDNGGSDDNGSTDDNGGSTDDNGGSTADNGGSTADNGGSTGNSGKPSLGGKNDNGGTKAPSSPAEIVKYYNDAINKVKSSKAGYTKKTTSNLGKLEGGEAIMKFSVARDAVYDFLGIGTNTYTNKKGEAKYLSNASLSAGDVTSAKCDVSGSTYTITMSLKDGASTAPGASDSSPLQRCGIYAGQGDKKDYDYKSADNLYKGLNGADNTSVQGVKERTKNAKIVAKIDSASGKMISLDVTFNWEADLDEVKYLVAKVTGTGYADTKVNVSGFAY